MTLAIARSRSGSAICSADGALLHSAYSPEREAERFLEASVSSLPSTIVLLGPCLDYLAPPLRRRFPGARIAAIQYSPFFRGREVAPADASWYPDSPCSLSAFLAATIDEDSVSGVAVLEWAPASRAFPEAARAAREALRSALDRLASSAATVKASGRAWILNSCRSFLLAERLVFPRPVTSPIVVAASGPSLERSLDLLSSRRESYFLIAVSSALAACVARRLEPDLVAATDGGAWSRLHLYPLSRGRDAPLALPLSALPSASLWSKVPLLLLDQGSFAESELLPFLGGGFPSPPHGTVAGSAIKLAAALGAGPVIVAGLDLAALGDASHARPHGFDHYLGGSATRLSSLEGRAWERRAAEAARPLDGQWRGSRSLAVYAAALSSDATALKGRLFRLLPSPQKIDGFSDIDARGLGEALDSGRPANGESLFAAQTAAPAPPDRLDYLSSRLKAWRETAGRACSLLGAGRDLPDPRTGELLRSLDLPDWAAALRARAAGDDPAPAASALALRVEAAIDDIERRLIP